MAHISTKQITKMERNTPVAVSLIEGVSKNFGSGTDGFEPSGSNYSVCPANRQSDARHEPKAYFSPQWDSRTSSIRGGDPSR